MSDAGEQVSVIRTHWLPTASSALVEAAAKASTWRVDERSAFLFRRGLPAAGFYILVEGAASFSRTKADGSELITRIARPGAFFGDLTIISGHFHSHDGRCTTCCRSLYISPDLFRTLLSQSPELAHIMLTRTAQRLQAAFDVMEDALLLSAHQRLAKRLLLLAEELAGSSSASGETTIYVTQEELAHMVGCSRQNLHKSLSEWQRLGIVAVGYGRLTVCQPQALRRLLE